MSLIVGHKKQVLVVGLGNPGKRYAKTRHNVGYMVVEAFAHHLGIAFKEEKRFLGRVAKGVVGDIVVRLLLPETYMNRSGMAVRKVVDFFELTAADVIVVADDIALDFGALRIKSQGSAGGHNGLKDIEQHLGTTKYSRLRVGVGDRTCGDLCDHVLSSFAKEEAADLDVVIRRSVEAIERWCYEDISTVMNDVNMRKKAVVCEEKKDEEKNKIESSKQ